MVSREKKMLHRAVHRAVSTLVRVALVFATAKTARSSPYPRNIAIPNRRALSSGSEEECFSQAGNSQCIPIAGWNDFVAALTERERSTLPVVLCPFSIQKPPDAAPIRISIPVRVQCAHLQEMVSECRVEGVGSHIIVSASSDITVLYGLTFADATKSAVVLKRKSNALLCSLTFENNFSKRGGALRIEKKASVEVRASNFVSNYGKKAGGAIYNKGELIVAMSTFLFNSAKKAGGAIYTTWDGYFWISLSSFRGNQANKMAPAVWIPDDEFDSWEDLGGNDASDNRDCDGFFHNGEDKCIPFKGDSAPEVRCSCPDQRVTYQLGDRIIDDFGYFIDGTDVFTVAESPFDLVIVDYSRDGSEDGEFAAGEVFEMKGSGDASKVVISYISIGEAEDYRYYWDESWSSIPSGAPSWLGPVNPQWEGNYKVEFWDSDWQDIVTDWLYKIVDAGFDGIYCDIVDAYYFYQETEGRMTARDEMIDFVLLLSDRARARAAGRNFFIFVQNAGELLQDNKYLAAIDGIGREDLFYRGNDKQEEDETNYGVANLSLARDAGKVVLVTDYISDEAKRCEFYGACDVFGFLCHTADRDLQFLSDNSCYPAT